MIKKKMVAPVAAVAVLLSGLLAYQLFAPDLVEKAFILQPDNTQIASQGREIYITQCASCHGASLEGQPNWRQRNASGRLPAPPHDDSGHTWHHADGALFNVTKYGPQYVAGTDYQSDMPAFEDILSDDEIIAVLSYIKGTWQPKTRQTQDEINRRTIIQ